MSTQNVALVHEESPSDQEDQSEGTPPVTVPKLFLEGSGGFEVSLSGP